MANGLKEMADELNLSISTVSRALNNTGRVSAETRRLVMDTAKKYNYSRRNDSFCKSGSRGKSTAKIRRRQSRLPVRKIL